MAEQAVPETTTTENMDLETVATSAKHEPDVDTELTGVESGANGESLSKRAREEGRESEDEDNDGVGGAKKHKVEEDKSVEEQRTETVKDSEGKGEGEEGKSSGRVSVGPMSFGSSVEMFDYFVKFLHFWTPNLNVNKYEYMVLLDLLKKGHAEPEKKIGGGIRAFQVRYHPMWKSRCFFLVRDDESVDDFSFRKCVDHILPLPENMKVKSDVNKALGGSGGGRGGKGGGGGGGGWGGGRGGGRGRGRGGKWRN